jgi:hypothetical protein
LFNRSLDLLRAALPHSVFLTVFRFEPFAARLDSGRFRSIHSDFSKCGHIKQQSGEASGFKRALRSCRNLGGSSLAEVLQ